MNCFELVGTERRERMAFSPVERLESRQLLSVVPSPKSVDPPARDLTVMTQNLYLGADLRPAVEAAVSGNQASIVQADSTVWAGVVATDFPARAKAIAKEVKAAAPDLIGLDEAALWQVGTAAFPAPANRTVYDFTKILIDRLSSEGLHYAAVAVNNNFTVEGPAFTSPSDPVVHDIRMTDRDVLLARTDEPASAFKLSNVQTHQFAAALPVLPPTIVVNRGWIQADVKVRGKTLRLISTHLEADYPPVRDLQAQQLLAQPAHTSLPTLLIGDFNSDADAPPVVTDPTAIDNPLTYQLLTGGGFSDLWSQVHPNDPGYTWGQASNLRNPTSTLSERIDFALTRGGLSAGSVTVVGDQPSDRTAAGLWPSDHAGLVASVVLDKQTGRPTNETVSLHSTTVACSDDFWFDSKRHRVEVKALKRA